MFVTNLAKTKRLCSICYLLNTVDKMEDCEAVLAELYHAAYLEALGAVALAKMIDSLECEN